MSRLDSRVQSEVKALTDAGSTIEVSAVPQKAFEQTSVTPSAMVIFWSFVHPLNANASILLTLAGTETEVMFSLPSNALSAIRAVPFGIV